MAVEKRHPFLIMLAGRKKSSSKTRSMLLLEQMIDSMDGVCDPIRVFSVKELKQATNDHDPLHLLHNDGWYKWYKGSLNGRNISIKKPDDNSSRTLTLDQAINDIVISVQMNNKDNVLKLLGICLRTRIPVMVYEFAENGRLSDYIYNYNATPSQRLPWNKRMRIATDIASTVAYLHTAYRPIIHRDINPSNVFLDRQFVAKLSFFSLAVCIPRGETQLEDVVCGTMGFIPPEYWTSNLVSKKGDVFSFGVLLMELLTGQKVTDFCDPSSLDYFKNYVKSNEIDQIWDPSIHVGGGQSCIQQQVKAVSGLALRCVETSVEERPTMTDVANQLKQIAEWSRYNYDQSRQINWEIHQHLATHAAFEKKRHNFPWMLTGFMKYYSRNRSASLPRELIDSCHVNCNSICSFSAKEVEQATNKYSSLHVLHEDGCYEWYRGFLDGKVLLVKRTTITSEAHKLDRIITDLVISAHMNAHENVLKLIGVCLETHYPIMVHEFAENGRLDDHLHHKNETLAQPLPWGRRLRIASEIAKAVAYLHTAFITPIIHRDIKPSNVFLGRHNVAKLSNFNISVRIPEGESEVEDEICGTFGYIAPEYFLSGAATEKNDVYSFGALLVELLTGQRVYDLNRLGNDEDFSFLEYFRNHIQSDELNRIVDPRILAEDAWIDVHQQVQAVSELALSCRGVEVEERPTMPNVARQLEQIAEGTLGQSKHGQPLIDWEVL